MLPGVRQPSENSKKAANNDDSLVGPANIIAAEKLKGQMDNLRGEVKNQPDNSSPQGELTTSPASSQQQPSPNEVMEAAAATAGPVVPLMKPQIIAEAALNEEGGKDDKDATTLHDSIVQKAHKSALTNSKATSPKKRGTAAIPLIMLNQCAREPTKTTLPNKMTVISHSQGIPPTTQMHLPKQTILPQSPLTQSTLTARTLSSPRSPGTTVPLRRLLDTKGQNKPSIALSFSSQNALNSPTKSKLRSEQSNSSCSSTLSDGATTAIAQSPITAGLTSINRPRSVEEAANGAIAAMKEPSQSKYPNEIIIATEKALKTASPILPRK
ncbi:unnamed protein product [Strongylus vulgaris]|uniref:Uncharacterized protein n=1 Tax=Strongylus vulgaris TaxID=40348 RepID=A0A3P7KUS0_STRVU|nr:unnamed protein product [Strongylus vulgaris]